MRISAIDVNGSTRVSDYNTSIREEILAATSTAGRDANLVTNHSGSCPLSSGSFGLNNSFSHALSDGTVDLYLHDGKGNSNLLTSLSDFNHNDSTVVPHLKDDRDA